MSLLVKLKPFSEIFKVDEVRGVLCASGVDTSNEVDFEGFLKVITCVCVLNLKVAISTHLLTNESIRAMFYPERVKSKI